MTDETKPLPRRAPVLIEDDDPALAAPPPPPEETPPWDAPAEGQAMTRATSIAAAKGRTGPFAIFLASAGGFLGVFVTVAAFDWVRGLIETNPAVGLAAAVLGAVALGALLVLLGRETWALIRLGRIDAARTEAERALREADRDRAAGAVDRLARLYAPRKDLEWASQRVRERRAEMIDAEGLLTLAEREWLTPLDQEARRVAEKTARQVATATALVPIPAADVLAALSLNLRMIRRIAEIYGGRGGALGAWRLFRAVAAHLVATGAVAAGDDLLGPVLGGGILAKLSRRFGEGLVNGALTARVGVAAIEVCRPLPFAALPAPKARNLVARALGDLATGGGERRGRDAE
ncbi:YcjF family protein [Albimonas sp. CAU 1670]|uniref:YcjF family protein n=1 Tax=Albimonas sp. CAU 1670 TaxID=3032599 RepID=UPI0023DBE2DD|nr:YcjF family protein [Albimonas sp. CAU 1670]MDF2231387.1 YcjF family protein [Albimonas sp. CAU 1670]